MKIEVIGAGWVGTVTAACFSEMGHQVVCVDIDAAKVGRLNKGDVPFFEPSLTDLVKKNIQARRLFFGTTAALIDAPDLTFICVGTPSREDGAADVSAVIAAAKTARSPIVVKSTVPVGTCGSICAVVKQAVLSNPEFLREGTAVDDFMRPDRIVIGVKVPDGPLALNPSTQKLRQLYEPFVRSGAPIIVVSRETAELSKYAANFMLATRISAMNELAELAGSTGADIEDVRRIVGADARIGSAFLYAGLGFGGSCFPKDVAELAVNDRAEIARAVLKRNQRQRHSFLKRILAATSPGDRVVVWGLAFKPKTSDTREAPALAIVAGLAAAERDVVVYDPEVKDGAVEGTAGRHALDAYSTIIAHGQYAKPAKALVLCTEWPEFRTLDTSKLPAGMHLFDGRNVWDKAALTAAGFVYHGIGR